VPPPRKGIARSAFRIRIGRGVREPGQALPQERGAAVRRASDTGGYWVIPGLADRVFSPGLVQGVSGIGYTWLRLARPELPSLLLYE